MDFLRNVPTTWDETRFLEGDPGKYVVVARRKGDTWYVAGVNATDTNIVLNVTLPFATESDIEFYSDGKNNQPTLMKSKTGKKQKATKLTIKPNGGVVAVGKQGDSADPTMKIRVCVPA